MFAANFGSYRFYTATTLILAISLCLGNEAGGQIAPDNTVNTQVETDDGVYSITGGIKSGNNLFHSFDRFSLTTDEVASFDNSLEIENIFGRITGGTISEIDGLIQAQGDASLFLLNPAGIIFGANAQLDIAGSFVASTADSLIFVRGEFSAVAPEVESLLTISSPVGLQYGSSGDIAVLPNDNRASSNPGLEIASGNTLALLGGNVSVEQNSLNATGSGVEIASVRAGKIGLESSDRGWRFNYQNTEQLGKIDFDRLALINSGRVNLRGETIGFSAGSGILDFNEFGETDNSISLNAAKSISIDDSYLVTQVGAINISDEAIAGRGGDIAIKAPDVFISNGSVISAGTLSQGAGGSIKIEAQNAVTLDAEADSNPSFISTSTQNDGLGGSIELNTGKLTILDGSQIQAFAGTDSTGKGGTIVVNADESIHLSGTGILRSQNVDENGEIDLLEKEFASGFSASSGDAELAIDGLDQAQGESGSLTINTPKLTIDRAAQISVNSYGLANAGNIKITTSALDLDTTGEIVANTASGSGGSISILADESIVLDGDSSILTTAAGRGNGGNIMLETANLVLLDSNRLSANAIEGNGGNIAIDTQGLFIEPNSSITASSQVETKQGNVEISTLDLKSRIATDYRNRSSLIVDDKITSGCGVGVDLNANQIRNVGAGGIPSNPFREATSFKTLNDWGEGYSEDYSSGQNYQSDRQAVSFQMQPIVEVSNWRVNSQGKVELVARDVRPTFTSNCQMNRQAN